MLQIKFWILPASATALLLTPISSLPALAERWENVYFVQQSSIDPETGLRVNHNTSREVDIDSFVNLGAGKYRFMLREMVFDDPPKPGRFDPAKGRWINPSSKATIGIWEIDCSKNLLRNLRYTEGLDSNTLRLPNTVNPKPQWHKFDGRKICQVLTSRDR